MIYGNSLPGIDIDLPGYERRLTAPTIPDIDHPQPKK